MGAAPPQTGLNPVDFLLAVDDENRVGALRFQDEQGVFQRAGEEGRRTAPPLIELAHSMTASRAVELNSETAADLAYLRGRGTSLGGLRPKCSVIDNNGMLSLGKFPSVSDDRAVTKGEVLALQLARAAGVNASEARIIDSDGVPVALIHRFDRPRSGGRIPYISAATLLAAEPGDPVEHAYTDIVDALRRYGADAQVDIQELWRRIAFSILINNVDDHLHNHGFLHAARGQWRLAPAFDINPFPDRARELKTWMLAGDIDVGSHGVEWARRSFPSSSVVYVPGNHEFYGRHMQDLMEELLTQGKRFGVDILDGRVLSIGGVRFLGATLWTDFALQGSDERSIDRAMADAQYGMNDFRLIGYGEDRMFRAADARAIHLAQVRWLRAKLAEEFVGSTVVVTHHLPHRQSIHSKYERSDLSPSFASDLGDLMGSSVSLWIHGHTHESFDYVVNGTRVICNPRGYFPMELNAAFDPVLTINLRSPAIPAGMS